MKKGKAFFVGKRMEREAKTVEVMIRRYCRDKHNTPGKLCPDCRELLEYARKRLSLCPFQENKTTCGKCPVHCYKPDMKSRVQQVMRYVGPRMIWSNPLLSLRHGLDGLRKEPLGRITKIRE